MKGCIDIRFSCWNVVSEFYKYVLIMNNDRYLNFALLLSIIVFHIWCEIGQGVTTVTLTHLYSDFEVHVNHIKIRNHDNIKDIYPHFRVNNKIHWFYIKLSFVGIVWNELILFIFDKFCIIVGVETEVCGYHLVFVYYERLNENLDKLLSIDAILNIWTIYLSLKNKRSPL